MILLIHLRSSKSIRMTQISRVTKSLLKATRRLQKEVEEHPRTVKRNSEMLETPVSKPDKPVVLLIRLLVNQDLQEQPQSVAQLTIHSPVKLTQEQTRSRTRRLP